MLQLSARLRPLAALLALLLTASAAHAQIARRLVVDPVDAHRTVALAGHLHPLAQSRYQTSTVPDSQPVERVLVRLARTPERQAALLQLLNDQQNPASPDYHRWLTPEEFGNRFGPAESDLTALRAWLEGQGFAVDRIASARNLIEISGTAAQLRSAFQTELRQYQVGGQLYTANASEPRIPAAFAPLVRGFASLNNFPRKPLLRSAGTFVRTPDHRVAPHYTVSSGGIAYYALGPADFATIYNTTPLLEAGINGAGQTIVVLGRTSVRLSDIADFRALFSLGTGNTSIIIDGPSPGIVSGDEDESVLDLEWANAVAPGAAVKLVSAADTATTSGLDLAAAYTIEHNLATAISESYGLCEAYLGASGNEFMEELWQQAAAQGTSVTISTGDSGSALCDNPGDSYLAANGVAVNGLASTSYNVAVGGTDFDDVGAQTTYWNSQNLSDTHASARSYIPETTWNESCAASAIATALNVCPAVPDYGLPPSTLSLWAGAGGSSNCITSSTYGDVTTCQQGRAKPAWQAGPGVPADNVRGLPDVALFSAANSGSHSFYVVCQADHLPTGYSSCRQTAAGIYFSGAGGTSAAAPSFAGILALAAQRAGARLGNVNALLYNLAAGSNGSCTSAAASPSGCIFHDVVKGNISVPCEAGTPNCSVLSGSATGVLITASRHPAYEAASGYDLATGLGSVNAANLAAAIAAGPVPTIPTASALLLNGSSVSLSARHGDSVSISVAVAPTTATGAAALTSSSATITSAPLSSGGAAWTSRLFPGGAYSVAARYGGDHAYMASDSNNVAVNIGAEPSRTLVNLVSLDASGTPLAYGVSSIAYGSNYQLRVDVGDAGMTSSSTAAPASNCSAGATTCPSGSVALTANGSALGTGTLSQGAAIFAAPQLPAGAYRLAAAYAGDAGYAAGSATADVVILKAASSVTVTAAPGTYEYGVPLTVTAQLATASYGASPAGSIALLDNGAQPGASLQSGAQQATSGAQPHYAALSYSGQYLPPSVGTHALSATYAGDANYSSASSSPLALAVTPATTWFGASSAVPASAAPGDAVTLYASLASSSALEQPTGTVTFYDNGTALLGTVQYSGNSGPGAALTASLAASFTTLGAHAVTAAYTGDAHYKAVTQALGTINVGRIFNLALPVSQVSSSGGASSVLLNVANTTASPLNVALACAPSSNRASCSITPPAPSVDAASSTTASVVYSVPRLSGASLWNMSPFPLVLALVGIGLGMCVRSGPARVMLLLFALASLLFAAGCGGGATGGSGAAPQSSTTVTTPTPTTETYTFAISGTAGSHTDSQVLTVTVH